MVLGPQIRKILPYINFVIATGALGFQVMVLYPWHKQLDSDFEKLKDDQKDRLAEYHELKLKRLSEIEDNIKALKEMNVTTRNSAVLERQLLEHEFARNKLKQYIDLTQNLES